MLKEQLLKISFFFIHRKYSFIRLIFILCDNVDLNVKNVGVLLTMLYSYIAMRVVISI